MIGMPVELWVIVGVNMRFEVLLIGVCANKTNDDTLVRIWPGVISRATRDIRVDVLDSVNSIILAAVITASDFTTPILCEE